MSTTEANAGSTPADQSAFDQEIAATQKYFDSPRFDGIIRLYSARQVAGPVRRA